MRIPSYDDLTPSIPDVSAEDVFASVARLLPGSGPIAADPRSPAAVASTGSFACLRSPRLPDVILAVARDFSPRIQRYPDAVVLDVGGLGRLLGPPSTIGVELARSAAARVDGARDPAGASAAPPGSIPPAPAPRYVSRYGLRIEPHPSEHGRVCSTAPDEPAAAITNAPDIGGTARALERAGIRIAVAPTQMAALLLSLDSRPLTVVTAESGERIAGAEAALGVLSLRVLQQFMAGIHGVTLLRARRRARPAAPPARTSRWPSWAGCEHTFDVLERWGLSTLGEFVALPAPELSARTGQDGVALQRLARGLDPAPLVPDPDVPRYLQRMELEWPVDGLEPLSFVLARLLDPLSTALERADRAGAAIRLDLRLVTRATHSRRLQLPVAIRDPRVLRTLLLLDLESHPPSAAIDVVTIEIDPAPGRVVQYSLLDRALPSAETLATLTARLGALVGDSRCGSPIVLDTHRPDAFVMQRIDAQGAARNSGGARDRGGVEGCIRRFRPPVAVRVRVDRGRPIHLEIDRRGMPGGTIVQAAGPWRSSGDWWTRDTPWDRDEWDVELSDGGICRLFQARDTKAWFLDGVLD